MDYYENTNNLCYIKNVLSKSNGIKSAMEMLHQSLKFFYLEAVQIKRRGEGWDDFR